MLIQADSQHLPIASGTVQTVVTSPPYWNLRDYNLAPRIWPGGWIGNLGLEPTLDLFIEHMVLVFREVRRVLKDDGVLWLNLGDSYATGTAGDRKPTETGKHGYWENPAINKRINGREIGLKPKDLVGIPWRLAFALQADGWWLRSDIVWSKNNPMPESVTDRPTKSHEYIFLLAKSERYYYNAKAIEEPASPDSHARYARGRSDNHKWADGGPGGQTIARSLEHMRDRTPSGWDTGPGHHHGNNGRYENPKKPGVHPKSAATGSGIKANDSFSAAVKDIVDTRNKRTVWTMATQPYSGAHFATFPEALVETCLLAGSRPGDIVFDPFVGSGTLIRVATRLQRKGVGCDLNFEYLHHQAKKRMSNVQVGMIL